MKIVDETEREDFENVITKAKRNIEDFECSEKETSSDSEGVHDITASVTVRNKTTGRAHTYEAGWGTAWVADFENDLLSGKFD